MKYLVDKVAVVTGAGSGIGMHTSIELAKRGCHLALVDTSLDGLQNTHACVTDKTRKVSVHQTDVSNAQQMQSLAREIHGIHGSIHILFNNAGIASSDTFVSMNDDSFRRLMDINVCGVVYGCRFFIPYLNQQSEAHILITSSIAGLIGLPVQTAYSMSKAAVRSLSETLRAELYGSNISVTCIIPGAVKTPILQKATQNSSNEVASQELAGQLMRFALPPEKAAQKIVRALEKNKARAFIGFDAVLIDILNRLAPVSLQKVFTAYYRRSSFYGSGD